jgi:Flp pilus assembly protein TadD
LNHRDPHVWGHITLVCLKTKKDKEAELALREALKLELRNYSLLSELGTEYFTLKRYNYAETCLALALESPDRPKNTTRTNRLFADCLFYQEKTQEATKQYQLVSLLEFDFLQAFSLKKFLQNPFSRNC